jgi:hypothetical protein
MLLRRPRLSPHLTLLVGAAFLLHATGCLSNQYVIPREELVRIAALPPAERGARVMVLQGVGDREQPAAPAEVAPPAGTDGQAEIDVEWDGTSWQHHRRAATGSSSPQGNWRGPGGGAGPVRASSGHSGWRSGGGGSRQVHLGSGGGGGAGEALLLVAAAVAVMAVFALVGMAASEGARYDGYAQLAPQQPLHLRAQTGADLVVPLAALSLADAAMTSEARVLEDEGPGLRFLGRRPLDRVGPTFKMTIGSLLEPPPAGSPELGWQGGIGSTIQLGYFATQRVGILGSLSLGAGNDADGRTFQRHGVAIELQGFPLLAGPLAVGGFAHGGLHLADDSEHPLASGPAVGGGVLVELALTTRLALAVRGDWTGARLDGYSGWTGSGSITAGLAIY